MIEHGVPSGTINRAPEKLEDPHFAAREAIVTLDHPRWGDLKMQASFPKMSGTPGSIRSIAPQRVGEHNDEVYGALGLSADERAALAAEGAI
jgi:formyl-CoA transferase